MNHEPGWDVVATELARDDATVSSLNYAEVLQKVARLDIAVEEIDTHLDALGVTVTPMVASMPAWRPPSTGTAPD